MRLFYSPKFKKELKSFPKEVRLKFYKQAEFLLKNLKYPSLRAKKYGGSSEIWQARADRTIRFYFTIQKDTYILLHIQRHK